MRLNLELTSIEFIASSSAWVCFMGSVQFPKLRVDDDSRTCRTMSVDYSTARKRRGRNAAGRDRRAPRPSKERGSSAARHLGRAGMGEKGPADQLLPADDAALDLGSAAVCSHGDSGHLSAAAGPPGKGNA